MIKPVYILNGPNLNLLGVREPEIYGRDTLEDIARACELRAKDLGAEVVFRQTNHEGVLIDWVQEAREKASAVIMNAAGHGHTSVPLLDALRMLDVPLIDCHLSNPVAREEYRTRSYVAQAAVGVVSGFGLMSYTLAVEAAVRLAKARAGLNA